MRAVLNAIKQPVPVLRRPPCSVPQWLPTPLPNSLFHTMTPLSHGCIQRSLNRVVGPGSKNCDGKGQTPPAHLVLLYALIVLCGPTISATHSTAWPHLLFTNTSPPSCQRRRCMQHCCTCMPLHQRPLCPCANSAFYVEFVVKDPMYMPNTYITSVAFKEGVEKYMQKLPHFATPGAV